MSHRIKIDLLVMMCLCMRLFPCIAQIYTNEDLDLTALNGTRVQICQDNTIDYNGTCVCDMGYGLEGGVCVACSYGEYKDTVGNTTCESCASHSDTLVAGAVSVESCLCVAGYHSPNSDGCVVCGVGTYKSFVGNGSCDACPQHTTSVQGSDELTDCLCVAGHTGPDGGGCTACAPDTYKVTTGSAACIDCPTNTNSVGGSDAVDDCLCSPGYFGSYPCEACAVDTYKSQAGSEACTDCPSDSSSPGTSTAIESCVCNAGYSGDSTIGCTACQAGTYKSTTGSQACVPCTGETFSGPGAVLCTSCPQDSQIVDAATSIAACQCNKGYAVDGEGNSCVACEVGKYKALVGDAACSDCAQGSYQDLTGASTCASCPTDSTSPSTSTNVDACDCNAGYFPQNGVCTACVSGTYKIAVEDKACTLCPENTYSGVSGATSSDTCQNCPTFSSTYGVTGASDGTACLCVAGYQSNGVGCEVCDAGYYCLGSSVKTQCMADSTSSTQSSSISDCVCNAQYYKTQPSVCTACVRDFYCPGDDMRYACPGNSTSSVMSVAEEDCTCVGGYVKN